MNRLPSSIEGTYPEIVFLTLLGIFAATWILTVSGLTVSQGARDQKTKLSLSKLQFGLWTIVVAGSWLGLVLEVFITEKLDLSQCPVKIPIGVAALMGVSLGSSATAKWLATERMRREQRKARAGVPSLRERAGLGSWITYTQDAEGIVSLPRAQMALWTVVAIIWYVLATAEIIVTVNSSFDWCSLPEVDSTLLLLMGVSHMGYLGMAHEKPTEPQPNPTPPTSVAPPSPEK